MYVTPAGEVVGDDHQGPKQKVADSMKEFRRLQFLIGMQTAGRLSGLRRDHSFDLHAHGQVMCRYRADFTYVVGGRLVVEDVKSKMTRSLPMYRLKKRWMKAEYGIAILES